MKTHILLLCALLSFALCSCDWIRGLLGMPTSEEIEAKKELIVAQEQRRIADSISKAEEAARIEDSLRTAEELLATKWLTGCAEEDLPHKYYVIVGSYAKEFNVSNRRKQFTTIFDTPTIIRRKDAPTLVAVAGFDTREEALGGLGDVLGDVPDAWIYTKKK